MNIASKNIVWVTQALLYVPLPWPSPSLPVFRFIFCLCLCHRLFFILLLLSQYCGRILKDPSSSRLISQTKNKHITDINTCIPPRAQHWILCFGNMTPWATEWISCAAEVFFCLTIKKILKKTFVEPQVYKRQQCYSVFNRHLVLSIFGVYLRAIFWLKKNMGQFLELFLNV